MRGIFLIFLFFLSNITLADINSELQPGYIKFIALSSTDDITSSKLKDKDGLMYSKLSIPINFDDIYEHKNYSLSSSFRISHLEVESDSLYLSYNEKFRPLWEVYSLIFAPKVSYKFNQNISFETEFEIGYSRFNNNSKYEGTYLKDILIDSGLLNLKLNTINYTPKFSLDFNKKNKNNDININTSLGYMFLENLSNKNNFNIGSQIGLWSVDAEYILNNKIELDKRNIDIVLSNNIGGFYGKDYRALGFGFINSSSIALQAPIDFYKTEKKIKIGVGYLYSDHATGFTFILGIK